MLSRSALLARRLRKGPKGLPGALCYLGVNIAADGGTLHLSCLLRAARQVFVAQMRAMAAHGARLDFPMNQRIVALRFIAAGLKDLTVDPDELESFITEFGHPADPDDTNMVTAQVLEIAQAMAAEIEVAIARAERKDAA